MGGAAFQSGAPTIGPLKTHYALMNSQEESLRRRLPIQVVAYNVYLTLLHSGMTAKEVLSLNQVDFGRFISQAWQVTKDPGLTPYERDFVPGVMVSMTGRVKLGARSTENMVIPLFMNHLLSLCDHLFCLQGLPCGANQFLGRTVRPLAPIPIPQGASIKDLFNIVDRAQRDQCVGARLGIPFLTHTPLVHCEGASQEPVQTVLTDVFPGMLTDDCESDTELATVMRLTALDVPESSDKLRSILITWPLFKNFTPECFSLLSQICNRGAEMLRDGILQIAVAVGSATSASAADVKKNMASYSGHCFNIGRIITAPPSGVCDNLQDAPDSERGVFCFLLEGTASSSDIHIPSLDSSIKIPVKIWHHPGMAGGFETRVMEFHEYLTLMGQSVTNLLQAINSPNGGRSKGGGWPVTMAPTKGWLSSQIFTPTLNSDRRIYMEFYHRVMYMGLKCVPDGQGCMPVELGIGDGANGIPELLAGCHPYDLNNLFLQGVDAKVPSEKFRLMQEIMNEAHPPMVDHAVFRRLSDLWAPCDPLATLNCDMAHMRRQGVRYVRIACMETPAIPELAPVFCLARHKVCTDAKEINLGRKDSDGAFFVCPSTPTGTGSHWFIEMPVTSHIPTLIHSLRVSLKRNNFPGYIPMGDED